MEIVGGSATIKAKKTRKLAMEDYLDFIENRTLRLKGNHLRQIIGMHGFMKTNFQKAILVEMVNSMDLIDLHRSTLLDDGVSGDACFTLTEAISDLKVLDWDECHVTSLLTQNAIISSSAAASGDGTVSVKRKKSKGKRRKRIEVEVDHSVISTGTTVAAGSTTEGSRPVVVGSEAAAFEVDDDTPLAVKWKRPKRVQALPLGDS